MTAITLTTDFGTADGYVGSMKGVIAAIEPGATIHDLTHQIPAQEVTAAAYALYRAVPYWPPGTVHCVVIDPGVGSPRRAIAARAERDRVSKKARSIADRQSSNPARCQ
jgi:S-adenosylmethionine hydrolase